MLSALLICALQASAAPDPISISARIEAEALEVGQDYEIALTINIPAGMTASKAGSPAPFLQIEAPPAIKLAGKVLTTHKELSRNEFLQMPYERLLKENPTPIRFQLLREPTADERIGLNVLAYVRLEGEEGARFMRRRVELPIAAGAQATAIASNNSQWGIDDKLLQIGDRAAPFELPRPDGTMVSLDSYLGDKNIVVTTYRAFW